MPSQYPGMSGDWPFEPDAYDRTDAFNSVHAQGAPPYTPPPWDPASALFPRVEEEAPSDA